VGCIPDGVITLPERTLWASDEDWQARNNATKTANLNKIAGTLMAIFRVKREGALRGDDYTSFPEMPPSFGFNLEAEANA
jgi:hypothetical protein